MNAPTRFRQYFLYCAWFIGIMFILAFVLVIMIQKATKNISGIRRFQQSPPPSSPTLVLPKFSNDRGVKIQHPSSTMDLELYYPSDMELYEGVDSWMIRRITMPDVYLLVQRRGVGQLSKAVELLKVLQADPSRTYLHVEQYQSKQGLDGYRTSWRDAVGQAHNEYILADGLGAFYLFSTTNKELAADIDQIVAAVHLVSRDKKYPK